MNWHPLTELSQIDHLLEESQQQAVVVFKHSTRCSISSTALSRLERQWNLADSQVKAYFLDLIRYREISNRIAEVLGVVHESPQLLFIHQGKCVHHSSHLAIDAQEVGALYTQFSAI
jgi:bacillithiol system protein YtxJ